MKQTLVRLGLAALMSLALFGCGGGGSDGVNGPAGTQGTTTTVPVNKTNKTILASNSATPTTEASAVWQNLQPIVTVNSVAISNGKPVVKFTVTDQANNAVVGLGSRSSDKTTASSVSHTYPALTNLAFTMAKLVPGTNGSPSRWVTYIVTQPLTVAQKAGTFAATDSCTADKTWCGRTPTTDTQGDLIDNGDGTYQYTFFRDITAAAGIVGNLVDSSDGLKKKADLGDLSYNPALTHRVVVVISGNAPGTGTNRPDAVQAIPAVAINLQVNKWFDFRPDGGAIAETRTVVAKDSCAACHQGGGLAHGTRNDPNYCVTCHTNQLRYGRVEGSTGSAYVLDGRAIGNYPNLVHKIHMGAELSKAGSNFAGLVFASLEYPQDQRNCTKCHNGDAQTSPLQAVQTPNGGNWKAKPNQLACGACHDGLNFATGKITAADGTVTNHLPGALSDDSRCADCHTAASVALVHRTDLSTANNPLAIDGVSTFAYDISSVTLNASRQPVIKFRVLKDGVAVTSFQAPKATDFLTNATTGAVTVNTATYQPIPGFTSNGMTFYAAFAVPQDGVAAPADFNAALSVALPNLMVATGSPKGGSITAADATGYMTATLTGDTVGQTLSTTCKQQTTTLTGFCVNPSPIVVPTNAKLVTGVILGGFTQVSTGRAAKVVTAIKAVSSSDARRVVVDTQKCTSCHEQLGTAASNFHGGGRSNATVCAICHTANRTSSGWSADASTFIHGIHGTAKRTVPFTWHKAVDATGKVTANLAIGYPGDVKNCEACHVANAVNFGAAGTTLLPNLLWSSTASGKFNGATDTAGAISPYVIKDNVKNYGNVFSFAAQGAVLGSYTPSSGVAVPLQLAPAGGKIVAADPETLVNSPVASACFSCHDGATPKAHMQQYGGKIYARRADVTTAGALVNTETCLVCHGAGRDMDVAVVHAR